MTTDIGVGVIGLGVMGATHARAYAAARVAGFPCRVVAASDHSVERLSGMTAPAGNIIGAVPERLFDPRDVWTTNDPEALLARPDVSLVSICTHTDTHVDLAIAALSAGKHVLVEKPVAVRAEDAQRLAMAANKAAGKGLLCMPAMCMRFWPAWSWLHERIREGAFGGVKSATFQRLGCRPSWAKEFYGDTARSGGAVVDLHIHDADFIVHCFGEPAEITSAGDTNHITTLYRFEDGPSHVIAEGAWDHTPAFGFRMRYIVNFEAATADFDLGRTPQLLLHRDGTSIPVEVDPLLGYDHQIRALLTAIAKRARRPPVTIAEAVTVCELLEQEIMSTEQREPVRFRSRFG